jgi:hypothetical protein
MMRWSGIALLIVITAAWATVGMAPWLVVGPWRLAIRILKPVNP